MEHSFDFLNKATIREKCSEDYIPLYGLFDSDGQACNWLLGQGWQQVLVNSPHRTFKKTLGDKERTVEVVKLDFEPIHLLTESYWKRG